MADYATLRRGRNAISTILHILLNLTLAITSTLLTVIGGNWIFSMILVVISKWRVVAVRHRYWMLNIKANIVDFTVGASIVMLVYYAGISEFNIWHLLLTIFYAVWLIAIKPLSSERATEAQALISVFLGSLAIALATAASDAIIGVVLGFIAAYGASRHILSRGEDHDSALASFFTGLIFAELYWIFYHWTIVYSVKLGTNRFVVPQLSLVTTAIFYTFMRGYCSAIRHDGIIRKDDIVLPAVFSLVLILIMLYFFSGASFNV